MAEEDFVVEAILGERYDPSRKTTQYLIKWLGYPDSENTWEAREDLFDDGHEAIVLEYERRRDEALQQQQQQDGADYDEGAYHADDMITPKKRSTRASARSKTPVKRIAAKEATPRKKATSKTPDTTKASGKKTPAKHREKSSAQTKTRSRSPGKKTTAPKKAELPLQLIEAQESRVDFIITGAVLGLALIIAGSSLNFLPLIVALALVRTRGHVDDIVGRASITLLWALASCIFALPSVEAPELVQNLSKFVWHYFFARTVCADGSDREVLGATILSWYTFVYEPTAHLLVNLASLSAVWAVITSVERWTMTMSLVDFFEALASGALLISQFTTSTNYVWVPCCLVTLSAVARRKLPGQ